MLPTEHDEAGGMLNVALALVVFAIVFAGWVWLRANHKDWGLGPSDAVVALIPIVVWLVVSGQLKQIKFGTEGFTAEFRDAVAAPIRSSVEKMSSSGETLPMQTLQADEKSSLLDLQKIIDKKDQVLTFVLGKKYVLEIAKLYLTRLTQQPFFRFVELQQNGGALYGLVDARLLFDHLKTDDDWKTFINAIFDNSGDYLSALPGYVSAALAVTSGAGKSDVLEKMEKQHVDWLPVTGPDGRLTGVVERSAILARLVLDLDKRLRQ